MNKILSLIKSHPRIVIFLIVLLAGGFFASKTLFKGEKAPQYQTAQAEKGTLITSVSASGQITTANNVQITIQVSGVVKEVYVKNGDQVYAGQNIATLTLDQISQQKAASAYAGYLSAKNSLDSAQTRYYTLQAAAFKANQAFINGAVARSLKTDDPVYIQENDAWLQSEADYKNQANVIAASQSSLAAASLNLSQLSSTITAPVAGVIKGLTIIPGASVDGTSQVLGSINQPGPIQSQVNISEIDSVSVSEGQKATLTLDAFPNQTFTGKVVSINTNGVTSSGVTTYPAVISFDTGNDHLYPNMSVTAKIITKIKNEVILVPSGAVQTSNGESTVRVLKNNQVSLVTVETGESNDTQTEIISGISEGEIIIIGTTSISGSSSTSRNSPFGGGGTMRMIGR